MSENTKKHGYDMRSKTRIMKENNANYSNVRKLKERKLNNSKARKLDNSKDNISPKSVIEAKAPKLFDVTCGQCETKLNSINDIKFTCDFCHKENCKGSWSGVGEDTRFCFVCGLVKCRKCFNAETWHNTCTYCGCYLCDACWFPHVEEHEEKEIEDKELRCKGTD